MSFVVALATSADDDGTGYGRRPFFVLLSVSIRSALGSLKGMSCELHMRAFELPVVRIGGLAGWRTMALATPSEDLSAVFTNIKDELTQLRPREILLQTFCLGDAVVVLK